MSRIKLHKLIFRPEIVTLLESAAGKIALPFIIRDPDGNILLKNNPNGAATGQGAAAPAGDKTFPIMVGLDAVGSVSGSDDVVIIADLVAALAMAETDKKAIAGEALHRYKELALLYGFTDQVSAKLDVTETAQLIIQEAQRLVPGDNFSVMLLPLGAEHLEIVAAVGLENPIKLKLKPNEGVAGRIFESGKAEILNNVAADERFVPGENKIFSLMCVPLKARQEVIGVLNISTEKPYEYSSEDLKLSIALGLVGAGAIGNARYTEELRQSRDRLEAEVAERTKKLEMTLLELTRTNKMLEHISMADPLTGVGNRRSFDQLLDSEWRRASRDGSWLSLILLDLDYFKAYNDNYGHQAGDNCLKRIVGSMRSSLKRPTDSIARYGGEEFAVVLANTNPDGAKRTAENLIRDIEKMAIPHMGSHIADEVTASAGVAAIMPGDKSSVVELIRQADSALYKAKQDGRNRISMAPATSDRPASQSLND